MAQKYDLYSQNNKNGKKHLPWGLTPLAAGLAHKIAPRTGKRIVSHAVGSGAASRGVSSGRRVV